MHNYHLHHSEGHMLSLLGCSRSDRDDMSIHGGNDDREFRWPHAGNLWPQWPTVCLEVCEFWTWFCCRHLCTTGHSGSCPHAQTTPVSGLLSCYWLRRSDPFVSHSLSCISAEKGRTPILEWSTLDLFPLILNNSHILARIYLLSGAYIRLANILARIYLLSGAYIRLANLLSWLIVTHWWFDREHFSCSSKQVTC